jgi:FtsP/CotA-like multicopper oxidase with cupredoxin domain
MRSKNKGKFKMTRRQVLKAGMIGGAGLLLPWKLKLKMAYAAQNNGSLPPGRIDKFVSPLVKPPKFPRAGKFTLKGMKNADYYEIAVRQFEQQILPPRFPKTTVWSYGPADVSDAALANNPLGNRYFYPAFTLENKFKKPTAVKWVNGLGGKQHLLPVDPSLHWANPIGRRDTRPNPDEDPTYWDEFYIDDDGRYIGPVPMVVHVHGAHTREEWDGYPEAWWLPKGADRDQYLNWTEGQFVPWYRRRNDLRTGPGFSVFGYPNDQPATTLWYHDHTLGMTRLNVYAGPAGFYLIRGGDGDTVYDSRQNGTEAILPGPAPGQGIDPFGDFYEIPIAIQDRAFNADGSLFYPDNRAFFEEGLDQEKLRIPFTFDQLGINPDDNNWGLGCDDLVSDVAPIWVPEYFGNVMVVNGFTWPYLDTEQRRYRFRLLNGCDSRFLILQFSDPRVEVWQIGAEQGFLPDPVRLNDFRYPGDRSGGAATILMGPAERADIIVDFTDVPVGTEVRLLNKGPDDPFGGGVMGMDFDPANPRTTGQVMQFRVMAAKGPDATTPPEFLELPDPGVLRPRTSRNVTLNEEESRNIFVSEENGNVVYDCDGDPFGPTAALQGTLDSLGNGNPLMWSEDITENPDLGSTEEWTIYNLTADAHPIHVHLVKFQVVDRQPLVTDDDGVAEQPVSFGGRRRPPEAWETGNKDTVIAYPGEVTRIKMNFDLEGFYVWHCHIVEHEDNEMMRPYHVGPIPPRAPQQ